MTSRSERLPARGWAVRVAEEANAAVAALTLADRLEAKALRNRFRRVEGNTTVPRFGAWYSPA